MNAPTLNGRVAKLEAAVVPATDPNGCRACGPRHVQPLTMAIVRGIVRDTLGAAPVLRAEVGPSPRLCRCDPCCGDPRDRMVARLTHGLPAREDAA